MSDTLLPCPCGRTDKGAQVPVWNAGDALDGKPWHVECACGWAAPKALTAEKAIALWNQRATLKQQASRLDAADKLIETCSIVLESLRGYWDDQAPDDFDVLDEVAKWREGKE